MKRIVPLAAACAVLAACVQYNEGAIAQPRAAAPDPLAQELVDARQAGMTMMVFTLSTLSRVADGDGSVKGAAFPSGGIEKFGKAIPGLFRADTAAIGRTEARSEIWQDMTDFERRADALAMAAGAARTAAAADDRAAFVTAVGTIKASCKSCHDAYRAE